MPRISRLVLSVGLLLGAAGIAQDSGGETDDIRTKLQQKLQQRRDLLRRLYPLMLKRYDEGTRSLEPMVAVIDRLTRAELAVATGREERIRAVERGLASAKKLEQKLKEQLELGRADGERLICAAAGRQKLAVLLAAEKTGDENSPVARNERLRLRDLLWKQLEPLEGKFDTGEATLESLVQLQDELMDAAIGCGRTRQERIEAAKRVIDAGKRTARNVNLRFELGRLDSERATLSKAALLRLELKLLIQETHAEHASVRNKRKELEEAFRARMEPIKAKYTGGETSLAVVLAAQADLIQSQMSSLREKSKRIKAAEQYVQAAQQSHNVIADQVEFGRADEEALLISQVGLLDAEIVLLTEQLR